MEDRVIILTQGLSVCERAHAQLSNSHSTKTHTYHMEDITGLLLHIYRNCLLLQIEPSG